MITLLQKIANGNVLAFNASGALLFTLPPYCSISVVGHNVHIKWQDKTWVTVTAGILQDLQTGVNPPVDVSGWTAQQIALELSNNFFFDVGNGGGATLGNWVFVTDASDLPAAVGGVRTLAADTTYVIAGNVDLQGDRLQTAGHTTIIGGSSETSYLTSTGLGVGVPLITSNYNLALKNLSISDVDTAIFVNDATVAMDWLGVNFLNVPNIGEIGDADNLIYQVGAFLNSKNLRFTGTIGTIGIESSLLRGDGAAGNLVEIAATATITRRFRVIYSAVIAFGATQGITVDAGATIPTEGFILDTISFSGGGTYLGGLDNTSNKSLFVNCIGITNTAVNGQAYMQDNATDTTITNTTSFFKVAGTTTPSPDNSKFLHSNNRLTCDAVIERTFFVIATLSFTSSANNVLEFGFYDSQITGIRLPSRTLTTANAGGRAENVNLFCVVKMKQGDFLEVHVRNTTGANNATIDQLNFSVTEIK
jgi:hypothetical protein